MDASKYDEENRLEIRRIYGLIPSTLGNKKKRIVVQRIEDKKGKRFSDYQDEFVYLINAGIALDVNAISTPVFPLIESNGKNLLKLYLNDVGLLINILYRHNVRAIFCKFFAGAYAEYIISKISESKIQNKNGNLRCRFCFELKNVNLIRYGNFFALER